MRLPADKKIIGLSLLLALGAALVAIGIVAPMIRQIKEMERTIFNLRSYMEYRYQKTLKTRTSAKDLARLKEEIQLVGKYLFRRDEELRLITDLERVASRHQVSYKITSPNLDTAAAGDIIDLSVQVSGAYRNVMEYVNDLEAIPYFLIIKDLRLAYAAEAAPASPVQLQLTMSLYVAR